MPSHRGDQKRLEKKKKKRQLARKQRSATAKPDVPTGDLAGIAGESVPAFLKFIDPLVHDGATEDEVRYAINVGAQLSAIALLPEAEREEHIATLMKTVGVGGADAQTEFRALAQTMIERHHSMFPNAHPGKPLLLEDGEEEAEGAEGDEAEGDE